MGGVRRRVTRLSAVWAAASCFACSLSACGIPIAQPAPSSYGTSVTGNSTLDQAGIARIKADRVATFDFTSGQLSRGAAGLEDGMQSPTVDLMGKGTMRLTIKGPQGTIEAQTDVLRALIFEGKPNVDVLTYFLTADNKDDFVALVRTGVAYGIDSKRVEQWVKSLEDYPQGRHYYALPPGYKTGLEVIYDLRFDYDKKVQVIIVTVGPKP